MRLHDAPHDESAHIALAADGDPTARSWVASRWAAPLHRFCLRMLRDEQDAQEVSQEVLVKLLRALDRYDPQRSFSTWAYGIARNACIDHLRRRRLRTHEPSREVADTSPTPLQEASRAERAERLHEALAEIPPMYREILVLYHFEHLKYTEIAEVLDLPLGTVMNRIFRARGKLRTAYEGRGGVA
ncbi:MAG: RNA polymerase sigma factor [Alphaproteobacteria bacterium]|nr:RNA polymerase sigma factor [Alphaproteobacteria bacterium]